MKINTNQSSLAAQRSLKGITKDAGMTLKQLSSGDRIIDAAVDPAGLAISEKMKAGIRSTQMAKRNANDGISMVQTADGSLGVISEMSIRMKELSVQAATDTVSGSERAMIDTEFQNLSQEIKRVMAKTEFNGKKLLSDNGGNYEFQVGITNQSSNRISYEIGDAVKSLVNFNLSSTNTLSKDSSRSALSKMDSFLESVSKTRASLGSVQARMHSSVQNLWTSEESMSASNSQIRDTDMAAKTAENARLKIVGAAATSTLAQANSAHNGVTKLL